MNEIQEEEQELNEKKETETLFRNAENVLGLERIAIQNLKSSVLHDEWLQFIGADTATVCILMSVIPKRLNESFSVCFQYQIKYRLVCVCVCVYVCACECVCMWQNYIQRNETNRTNSIEMFGNNVLILKSVVISVDALPKEIVL